MDLWTVYLITCVPSGMQYVGCTRVGIEQRWQRHWAIARDGGGSDLHDAIREHGPDAFTRVALGTFDTKEAGEAFERLKIAELGTLHPNGLNVAAATPARPLSPRPPSRGLHCPWAGPCAGRFRKPLIPEDSRALGFPARAPEVVPGPERHAAVVLAINPAWSPCPTRRLQTLDLETHELEEFEV